MRPRRVANCLKNEFVEYVLIMVTSSLKIENLIGEETEI